VSAVERPDTILLVDDEDLVRNLVHRLLVQEGYGKPFRLAALEDVVRSALVEPPELAHKLHIPR